MTAPSPSVLLEGFSANELDRELLARAVQRGSEQIGKARVTLACLRLKNARRCLERERRSGEPDRLAQLEALRPHEQG